MQIEPVSNFDSEAIAALRSAGAAAAATDAAAAVAPPRWESLRAHWRAWLPILMRMLATGLGLLGLAGIGWAARGSSELPGLARAPLAAGFAQMLGSGPLAAGAAAERPAAAPGVAGPGVVGAGTAASGTAAAPHCSCDEPMPCASSPEAAPPSGSEVVGAVTADGRVVLNLAGALDLQRLPGIGAKRAAAILELRRRLGRFRRSSDLLRVKGIGRRMLERMSAQLVLDAPPRDSAASAAGAR